MTQEFINALLEALKSSDPDQRRNACFELGGVGGKLVVGQLIQILSDKDGEVRKVACESLGKIRDNRSVEPLINCLDDTEYLVRFNATVALGIIKDKRAVLPLIEKLRDGKRWVRHAACESLENIGDKIAVPPLLDRLHDSFDKTRAAALEALASLGEGPLASAIVRLDHDDLIKIAQDGDPRPIDTLIEMLITADKQSQDKIKKILVGIHKELKPHLGHLICTEHFSRFKSYTHPDIKTGTLHKLHYYACRICGKASYGIRGIEQVIAVLDREMINEVSIKRGILKVNALMRKDPFDIEKVEIKNADDNSVLEFIDRVKSDTDLERKRHNKKVECVVGKSVVLSEEVVKNLDDAFGKVTVL
ncbi:HEAT repeat domain-containing protein [bacterium]|nr:HEAT repeat domain-containing protein [bacterium]MBU1025474.1 HEAT repeat domain-containing protein [bacterium]